MFANILPFVCLKTIPIDFFKNYLVLDDYLKIGLYIVFGQI